MPLTVRMTDVIAYVALKSLEYLVLVTVIDRFVD